ncbi:phosphate ABC transporter permease PstA [Zavarzinia compransoris]|uniref:Phosphate transport system permease protein PstA n=1 Tax=Zavarzinia compransoris TaxID=1264899 RepID=A0A317E5G5_9PROT|nr:phosphate ABC transporter permease PstA [Zavarzinia compransoris]PWR21921.1 phosphate ABC transporter permease PtsA [Zavarzinia compransoris]TDP47345.1 phosphate ABC transporter membrane protein 2 (PhoT family) [Zavarzinia compransoris]
MTDVANKYTVEPFSASVEKRERFNRLLKKRYAAEARFKMWGIAAISVAVVFLVLLLGSIIMQGSSAFVTTRVTLDVHLDPAVIDPQGTKDPKVLAAADYNALLRKSMQTLFPEVEGRGPTRAMMSILSSSAPYAVADFVRENPDQIGQTVKISVLTDDIIDMLRKGYIDRNVPESDRKVDDFQLGIYDKLVSTGAIAAALNTDLLTTGDSREPENAGLWGAVVGSFLTLIVTIGISFPLGVMAAIYLEEFAPKNRWTDMIEVNINNLAAVPSIVFGLLGLAVFLNFFGMPRSAPLVGGLVLALQALPIIIIASRAAIKAVPPSIREAALGMGASPLQTVVHHTLPLSMPGMLTGAILGMAHALGETAPLLMIGMVAFIVDIPSGFTSPATVLPVQIYLWADSPERAFVEKTSAAIMVLLVFLVFMNAAAIYLRKKFERKW